MALSVLVAVDNIRAIIPCSLLSFSMIPFATFSFPICASSWIVNRKVFQQLDNILYKAYMRLCLFVFENVSGVQLKLYGDVDQLRNDAENVLVLSNHQSNVDWAIIMMLATRQTSSGSDGGFRVMVKEAIHYVPLFGWYIFQHGYIYVRRFGSFVGGPVLKQLEWLDSLDENYWLLVFPEGTRFSMKKADTIKASKKFCQDRELKVLENVLCPRAGGLHMAIDRLKSLDAVYDITIGYGQTRLPGRRGLAPNMFEFCCGPIDGRFISVHIKRFTRAEIPSSLENTKKWLMDRYQKKDEMMADFYATGEFPCAVSLDEPSVSIYRTLPPTLFFSASLIAPFYFPIVRKAYCYTMLSFPLLILWLKIRKCV